MANVLCLFESSTSSPAHPLLTFYLQQLQPSSDLVDHTLRCGTDTENGHASRLNLCTSSVLDHLSGDAQGSRLFAQFEDLFLRLALDCDLGLAEILPATEKCGSLR